MSNESSYEAPIIVELFNSVPRFGHSVDLASVATNQEGWEDYALGVITIGVAFIASFLLWLVLEMLFLAGRRCGLRILSGKRMYADKDNCCFRLMVLSFSILSFLVGVIFLIEGTSSLEETFLDIHSNVKSVADMARSVTYITDKVIQVGNDTIPIRDKGVELFENGVCNSFPGGNGQTINFDAKLLSYLDILRQLSDFAEGNLTDLRNNFEEAFIAAETECLAVLGKARHYSRLSYYGYAVIALNFLLSMQSYMAWFGPRSSVFFCFQSVITIPLYFIVLFLSAIVVAALSAVLVVNTDICIGNNGNPESFIWSVLDNPIMDEYAKEIIHHYIVNGCEGDFKGFDTVNQLVNDLVDGNQAVIDLATILETEQRNFEGLCGGGQGSLDAFKESLTDVKIAFSSLTSVAMDARDLLQCDPINSLYKDFFHNDVCESLPNTIAWMFVTAMLVVVFGVVIFTLRGALFPPKDCEEYDDSTYRSSSEQYEEGKVQPELQRKEIFESILDCGVDMKARNKSGHSRKNISTLASNIRERGEWKSNNRDAVLQEDTSQSPTRSSF